MKKKVYIVGLVVAAAVMVGWNAMAAEPQGIALCAPMSGGAASWGKKADVFNKILSRKLPNYHQCRRS